VLIAGTSAATLISAASFAAPINNDAAEQDQDGAVSATDTVTVGDADTVVSIPTAQGNTLSGVLIGESAIAAQQSVNGAVSASSDITADQLWSYATATATAQGNALTARVDGDLDLTLDQQAGAGASASALSALRISTYAGHTVQTAVSAANAAEVSGYGSRDLDVTQASAADSTARATLDAADAEIETVALAAVAAGNSLTATGYEGDLVAGIDQTQSGDVAATAEAVVGNADYGLVAASQAAGNTVTLQNDYGFAGAYGGQSNSGAVSARTTVSLDQFANGFGTVTADAVGNSALTSNIGANAHTGLAQTNTGAVSATATLTGGLGGGWAGPGAVVSASAMGNAQSAYVCAVCPVGVTGAISQTNGGAVSASANTAFGGGIGAITSSATAVGNAATFSTRPGG
jgi:hypothetical protein